jgi:transcriptional regulator with XRE-family HTH domain
MLFAKELERMLDGCGITRVEVADRVGISTYMLWLLQAGKRLPTPDMIDRVARAIGISPEDRKRLHRLAAGDRGYRF